MAGPEQEAPVGELTQYRIGDHVIDRFGHCPRLSLIVAPASITAEHAVTAGLLETKHGVHAHHREPGVAASGQHGNLPIPLAPLIVAPGHDHGPAPSFSTIGGRDVA